MDQKVLDFMIEKTRELINAATCSSATRAAAQAWLKAVGSDGEGAETLRYIQELEEDIMPLDNLIAFARSPKGAEYFGPENAVGIAAHGEELKAAGAKYCDCPACAAAAAILGKKAAILG